MNYEKGIFMWAVEQMKGGKKVRCLDMKSVEDCYCYEKNGKIHHKGAKGTTPDGDNFENWIGFFEATDWEIYEETDTWNLADEVVSSIRGVMGNNVYDGNDIKTFIQKVKEEITNHNNKDIVFKSEAFGIIDKRAGKLQ